MLIRKFALHFLAITIIVPQVVSCSVTKDIEERRNYMIPKKSDLPANSRYQEPGKRKTITYKPTKSRRKSLF